MKKVLLALSLVAALAGLSVQASAHDFSYSYLDGSYAYQHNLLPHSGVALDGSYALNDHLFVVASTNEYLNSADHLNVTTVGAGLHTGLTKNVDVFGEVGGSVQAASTPARTTTYGQFAEAGLRVAVLPNIELLGGAEFVHDNLDTAFPNRTQWFGVAGVNYEVTSNLGLIGEVKSSGQQKEADVGVRYNF